MNTYLRELTVQFAKFGIVGVIAFCIDYWLFLLMTYVFGINYLIASASMRYVFAGKRGQTRSQQFVIFFVLSVVGLGVNQLVLWMCVDLLAWLAWVGKLAATFIVMIFNFVTRKVFLEDHDGRRR